MKFLAALRFLTTIPLPGRHETTPEELGHSAVYFPLVGLIIGFLLAGLDWVLNLILPPQVTAILVIVFLVILTGGLHLDGFSDTCDGIGGQKSVQERWQVMHDSRVGSFGVIGVVLMLLVKYVALANVPTNLTMITLIFMPVVSRWAMVYAIFAYPYARPAGLGKFFKQSTRWPAFTVATAITITITLVLVPLIHLAGLVIIVSIWLMATLTAIYMKSKFDGLTGDNYGAINEVSEASIMLLFTLMAYVGLL